MEIKDIPKEDLKIVIKKNYHSSVLGYLPKKGYFIVEENALKKKYLDHRLRKAKTD